MPVFESEKCADMLHLSLAQVLNTQNPPIYRLVFTSRPFGLLHFVFFRIVWAVPECRLGSMHTIGHVRYEMVSTCLESWIQLAVAVRRVQRNMDMIIKMWSTWSGKEMQVLQR